MKKSFILSTVFGLFSSTVFAIDINSKAGTTGFNFLKIGVGARPIAMGEAFVASAGDINSLYWNPAGIAQLQDKEITFSYNSWLESINYGSLGTVYPFNKRAFGVSVVYLNTGKIDGYDKNNTPTDSFTASDLAIGISYAQEFNKKFFTGGTFKVIQEKLEKESAVAYTTDIGAIYFISENILLGAEIQNIGTGIKFVKEIAPPPVGFKLGCEMKLFDKKLNIHLDLNKPVDYNLKLHLGVEYWLIKDIIAFRAGYRYQFGSSNDYNGLANISAGVGFRYFPVTIDYAFVPYGDLGNTHRISLNIKFTGI
jgi:long-subunit fatty acid transport protein